MTLHPGHLDTCCPMLLSDEVVTRACLEDDICTVCIQELISESRIRKITVCGHLFHDVCITQWLVGNSMTCPICRVVVSAEVPVPRMIVRDREPPVDDEITIAPDVDVPSFDVVPEDVSTLEITRSLASTPERHVYDISVAPDAPRRVFQVNPNRYTSVQSLVRRALFQ